MSSGILESWTVWSGDKNLHVCHTMFGTSSPQFYGCNCDGNRDYDLLCAVIPLQLVISSGYGLWSCPVFSFTIFPLKLAIGLEYSLMLVLPSFFL
jgi:hypothetical protein